MHRGKTIWRHRENMTIYKPRRMPWNRAFPHSPQKETTLPSPWFWTCRLRSCETIDFCCLSHLVSGTLLQHPLGTNTDTPPLAPSETPSLKRRQQPSLMPPGVSGPHMMTCCCPGASDARNCPSQPCTILYLISVETAGHELSWEQRLAPGAHFYKLLGHSLSELVFSGSRTLGISSLTDTQNINQSLYIY